MNDDSAEEWHTVQRVMAVSPGDEARQRLYVSGARPLTRVAFEVASGAHASSATYFGAFPAAIWRAHSRVREVRLAFRSDGPLRVELRRTDLEGTVHTLATRTFGSGPQVWETGIAEDTSWLWFDVHAEDGDVVVDEVRWDVRAASVADPSLTIGITTFNREADCLRLLERLASEVSILEHVLEIIVADQGTRALSSVSRFDQVAEALGARLTVVRQANLGGSGGFSRAMSAATASESSHVLLLDDDVDLEPESIARLVAFARFADSPLIVGAQMLSLTEPMRLHSFGERVDRRTMWWAPVVPTLSSIDLAEHTVENTPELSRPIDVDFNGWWMCLIPTDLVRSVGASLPFFIKWDDAEFGLRAAASGVRTVTLPGAALWHMPWSAKDDGLDWQAYFQLRNRLVTALLHGGRGVISASFTQDLNHILCGQYGSAALRIDAIRDVLSGPHHLEETLRAGPSRPAAVLADAGQSIVPDTFRWASPPGRGIAAPVGRGQTVQRLVNVIRHQLRRPRQNAVVVRLSRAQGKWWAVGGLDGAVVEAASGAGVFVVRRDRGLAGRLLRDALISRLRLHLAWGRLATRYRAASRSMASTRAWDDRFAEPVPDAP